MPKSNLVNHRHKPNSTGTQEAARNNLFLSRRKSSDVRTNKAYIVYTYLSTASIRYLHQDKDVHGVIILTECARNETIVVRVHN